MSKQQTLWLLRASKPFAQDFDGETYDRHRDQRRLGAQLEAVRDLMSDGTWRTLAEMELRLGCPQASISARLRDLRKLRFGGLVVERRRRGPGTFEYRVQVKS